MSLKPYKPACFVVVVVMCFHFFYLGGAMMSAHGQDMSFVPFISYGRSGNVATKSKPALPSLSLTIWARDKPLAVKEEGGH